MLGKYLLRTWVGLATMALKSPLSAFSASSTNDGCPGDSRISALGPVDHCTSHFKRAVCISCRPCVDVHKGGGGSGPCGRMWTGGGGSKTLFFCGRHKWMAPKLNSQLQFQNPTPQSK